MKPSPDVHADSRSDAPTTGARLRELLLDPRAHGALLVAGAALVILARAGAGPLANYDDAYYAEKAKQMLRTGDWLTPRFAGVERLDNPPLCLWVMACSFAVMGVNAFAAVLGSALAGVGCVGLTHRLALRLGREPFEAWAAAVVLLGTGYFLKYANHAMFDVFLVMLFLGALLAYRRAWDGSAWGWAGVGVCTGLGVLTKSVLGLLPLAVVAAHVVWCGRAGRALRSGAAWAPIAAVLVPLPWYAYHWTAHHDAFVREHLTWLLLMRGLGTGREAGSPASPFGYVRELAVTYWPWLPLALAGLWRALREALARAPNAVEAGAFPRVAAARLLVLWPVLVVGGLSLAHEKKLWYVMSAFPALALLSAGAVADAVRSPSARARLVVGGFALIGTAGAILALTPFGSAPPRRPDLQVVARAAHELVPAGSRIVFDGGNYFSVAHQFIFYSDRLLVEAHGDSARVREALRAGGWALFSGAAYARLPRADSLAYPVVLASGGWRLVHAAPAPLVRLDPDRAFE